MLRYNLSFVIHHGSCSTDQYWLYKRPQNLSWLLTNFVPQSPVAQLGSYRSFHGRRSSKGFGGAPNFCPKNDLFHWICPKKRSVFLSKLRWPQKKKKIHCNWDGFMNMKLPKVLTQTYPKNMKLPKFLTQNCPNNMKLPKISRAIDTLKPSGGPVPPPFYATGSFNPLPSQVTMKIT